MGRKLLGLPTGVSDITFVSTISSDRTISSGLMTFSMDTLSLTGNTTVYTISNNAYHFVLNPAGFALFN